MGQMGQFIINHWGLWLAFIVILLLVFINELLMKGKQGGQITPHETVALMNNGEVQIYDLRDNDAFKKGHILNSKRCSAEEFSQPKMNANKDKSIVLVCANGQSASGLATKLRTQGFGKVQVLAGGLAAWQQADLPLVKGK